jgi:hypothetical protein
MRGARIYSDDISISYRSDGGVRREAAQRCGQRRAHARVPLAPAAMAAPFVLDAVGAIMK